MVQRRIIRNGAQGGSVAPDDISATDRGRSNLLVRFSANCDSDAQKDASAVKEKKENEEGYECAEMHCSGCSRASKGTQRAKERGAESLPKGEPTDARGLGEQVSQNCIAAEYAQGSRQAGGSRNEIEH